MASSIKYGMREKSTDLLCKRCVLHAPNDLSPTTELLQPTCSARDTLLGGGDDDDDDDT